VQQAADDAVLWQPGGAVPQPLSQHVNHAGGIEELNEPEWLAYLKDNGGSDGVISQKLAGYEELGRDLGIRTHQAAIVSGPRGTRTLQDAPSLAQIEAAIEAVR